MQASPVTLASPGIPLPPKNTIEAKRRVALNAMCVTELMLAIWSIFFTTFFWFFVIAIPIDLLGIIAVRRMQQKLLIAFSFLKSLMLGVVALMFADFVTGWSVCQYNCSESILFQSLYMIILIATQIVAIFLSTKIRRDILMAETMSNVELTNLPDHTQFNNQIPQQPQMPTMSVPQHFQQDPHATAGVPGYPYPPPQYYPAPYMNQPYPTPYAHYPPAPSAVSTYPSYTISDEQQFQQHDQQFQQHDQQFQQHDQQQQPPHIPDNQPLLYTRE